MKKSLFAVIGVFVAIVAANAAPKSEISFLTVDMGELYARYYKAEESQKKFSAAMKNAQDEINTMKEEGMKVGQEFEALKAKADNPSLTESARKKFNDEAATKAKDIEQRQIEIIQYQQQASQTLAQRRQSVLNLHLNEIKEEISKIAKERGANLVLNSTGIVIMYADEKADITEEALKRVNSTQTGIPALPPARNS